jgi:hypothetical protein
LKNPVKNVAAWVGAGILLSGCTGGQIGVEPTTHVADVQNTTQVQFRVGTARFADGNTYLNTLVTYRQTGGLSATLYNTPVIAGPAGFTVPSNAITTAAPADTDVGTSSITGTPPTQPGTTAVSTTFNQSGGAFAYGFAPANSTTAGAANYPKLSPGAGANNALYRDAANAIITGTGAGNTANVIAGGGGALQNSYAQPFFLNTKFRVPFIVGPPAVPDFHDGTFPTGFIGYPSGFTMFAATPVAGTYTLTVTVPGNSPGAAPAAVFTAPATLTSAAGLGATLPPTIASTAGGGATFTVAAAPAGVTNQVLYVVDVSAAQATNGVATFYTFPAGAAGGTFALSPTSGPVVLGSRTPPFATGDSVYAYVVGADYDILGLAPPANTSVAPALPATADITVSKIQEIVY